MSLISSLHLPATAVVIGAGGGIGNALTRRLAAEPAISRVVALARGDVEFDDSKIRTGLIDLSDENRIRAAAADAARAGPLDLVIVASGILHRAELSPEKSMREWRASHLSEVFTINAIGPALAAKHFLPNLRRGRKSVFAALSARVGSIGDNRLGGWAAYRASKAALNMLVRTAAIEQARRWPDAVVVSLHPGTVATALSRPFTRAVSDAQLKTPDQAAAHLLGVIDALTPQDSGGFFAWDGAPIEF